MGRHLDLRTQEGAPSAVTRARYRRRDCERRAARGAARVVHSRCQTACVSSFPHHGLACGFSCLPLHLHCVRLVTRPRNEGAGGAPGGALPVVALVRRDATLARRGPSRAIGTPPLGAPPWRCRPRNRSGPGTICGIRPVGCSRPAIVHGGLRHRAFSYPRFTSRGRRHSPLRLLDRLRRRPLMSEDGESILHLHIVVNR